MKEYKNQPISKNNYQSQGKIQLFLKKNLFLIPLLAFFTLSPFSCALFRHKNEPTPQLEKKIEASERALSGRGRGQVVKEGIDFGSDLFKSIRSFFSRVGPKAKTIEYPKFNTKWKEWAEAVLRRNLTETEAKALSDAYYIRYFTPENIQLFEKAPKALAELVNFTDDDLKNLLLQERNWILNQAGFTDEEINLLLLEKTEHKNMFDIEIRINEQLENNARTTYGSHSFFNSLDELPEEFQAQYKPLDENRQQLKESLENGELKEGASPFIIVKMGAALYNELYKIVKIDKPDEITVQTIDGKLKTLTNFHISPHFLTDKDFPIDIASPEVSKLFSAIASTRRRVTIEELNLPQRRDLPLPPSSHDPEYTAGWTQIQEGIAFTKAIRELDPPPNPYKTHIEWFVPQISKSIENARQYFRQLERALNEKPDERITVESFGYTSNDKFPDINQLTEDLQEASHRLEILEAQALQVVQEERVTYSWWLEFNTKLLAFMPEEQKNIRHSLMEGLIESFPIVIAFPIRQADYKELGIMSINRAYQNNLAPIEITSTLTNTFDGMSGGPLDFFNHDLGHVGVLARRTLDRLYHSSFPLREAEKTHVQFMDSLQGEERIQMENIYFLNRHEEYKMLDNNILQLR